LSCELPVVSFRLKSVVCLSGFVYNCDRRTEFIKTVGRINVFCPTLRLLRIILAMTMGGEFK
jgi:hypothetical protein